MTLNNENLAADDWIKKMSTEEFMKHIFRWGMQSFPLKPELFKVEMEKATRQLKVREDEKDRYWEGRVAEVAAENARLREALEVYADESNWGNGGWEGHPNDYFNPSRINRQRGWEVAKEALNYKVSE